MALVSPTTDWRRVSYTGTGYRLASVGDSNGRHNHNFSTGVFSNEARGEVIWASRLSGGKFFYDAIVDAAYNIPYYNNRGFRGLNNNISGATSADVLTKEIDAALAMRPAAVLITIGINDITGGVAIATIKANILEIARRCLIASSVPIVTTVPPATSTYFTGSGRAIMAALNQWIRTDVRTVPGVWVWDRAAVMTDPLTGEPRLNYFDASDMPHFTILGGYANGKSLVQLLNTIFPGPTPVINFDPLDVVSASNPTGNILPNPGLTLGGGGTNGTGVTGSVASLWRAQRTSGSTVTGVAARTTDATLGNVQTLTLTLPGGGSGGDTFQWYQATDIDISSYAGQWLRGGCYVRVGASTLNTVVREDIFFNDIGNAFQWYGMRNYNSPSRFFNNEAHEGWIETPPMLIGGSATTASFRMTAGVSAATAGSDVVFTWGQPYLRVISNPDTTIFLPQ